MHHIFTTNIQKLFDQENIEKNKVATSVLWQIHSLYLEKYFGVCWTGL